MYVHVFQLILVFQGGLNDDFLNYLYISDKQIVRYKLYQLAYVTINRPVRLRYYYYYECEKREVRTVNVVRREGLLG